MKKRIISVLLVVAMVAALFVGCGKKDDEVTREPYKPTITNLEEIKIGPYEWPVHWGIDYTKEYNKRFDGLTFTYCASGNGTDLPEGYTMEENPETWQLQGRTGLDAEVLWAAAGSAYNQKLGQAITIGDIPDVMTVSLLQYREMVKAGLLADLTDELLEAEHPTIQEMWAAKDNLALKSLMVDGRIYGVPTVASDYDGAPLVWVRKDWLEKLGIEGPKSYEDLTRVAKAFMEQDPDGNGKKDTIGIPCIGEYSSRSEGSLSEVFLNVGKSQIDSWNIKKDGTLVFGNITEGAKKALTFLNKWYEEGIIESDFATWDTSVMSEYLSNNKAGIMFGPWFSGAHTINDVNAIQKDAEWEVYMLPGKEGEQVLGSIGDILCNVMVVSKKFSHPEAFVYAYDMSESAGNKYNTGAKDPGFGYSNYEGYIAVSGSYKPVGSAVRADYYTGPAKSVLDSVADAGGLDNFKSVEELKVAMEGKVEDAFYTKRQNDAVFPGLEVYYADLNGKDPREVSATDSDGKKMDPLISYQTFLLYWQSQLAIVKANPEGRSSAVMTTTKAMTTYQNFVVKYSKECFTKMIMGRTDGKSIDEYFDEYVKNFQKKGGKEIEKEVNEFFKENQID